MDRCGRGSLSRDQRLLAAVDFVGDDHASGLVGLRVLQVVIDLDLRPELVLETHIDDIADLLHPQAAELHVVLVSFGCVLGTAPARAGVSHDPDAQRPSKLLGRAVRGASSSCGPGVGTGIGLGSGGKP